MRKSPSPADEVSSPETAQKVLEHIERGGAASIRGLEDALAVSRSTAHRALKRLLNEGRIIRTRENGGKGYPCQYEVVAK